MGDGFCMLHETRAKGEDKIANIVDTKKKEETLTLLILPQNQEACWLETRKALDASDAALIKSKSTFAEKIDKLKHRAQQVQREQEKLRKQLVKYNNFVREKRLWLYLRWAEKVSGVHFRVDHQEEIPIGFIAQGQVDHSKGRWGQEGVQRLPANGRWIGQRRSPRSNSSQIQGVRH